MISSSYKKHKEHRRKIIKNTLNLNTEVTTCKNRAYTFTDAIIRFGQILNKHDLDDAYKRAGTAFRGQLEQHFVVLRDWKRASPGSTGPGASSGRSASGENRAGKRPRQQSPENQPAKSKKK